MKIRLVVALVGMAISFALPAFSQQKDTADPQIAQQIRVLAMKSDEAYNRNDPAAVAAFYTEDAVRVTQQRTSHGREAIEKEYANVFQHWRSNNHVLTVDRVIAAGNEVRAIGTWSSAFRDTNGAPRNDEGHFRWVLVREGDTWKIRRETSSSSNFNATNG